MRLAAGLAGAALLALAAPAAAAQPVPPPRPDDARRVALIAAVKPAVVHVRAARKAPAATRSADPLDALQRMVGKDPRQPEQGSGFVIDSGRGLVITAAHIVDEAESVDVLGPDGLARRATVERIDSARGFALLRVPGLALPALKIADRQPEAGESAMLVGWMLPDRALLAIEAMVVGAIMFDAAKIGPDAPVGPYHALGASLPGGSFGGAPVVDSAGRAVGIISAIYGQGHGLGGSITLMLPLAPLAPLIGPAVAP